MNPEPAPLSISRKLQFANYDRWLCGPVFHLIADEYIADHHGGFSEDAAIWLADAIRDQPAFARLSTCLSVSLSTVRALRGYLGEFRSQKSIISIPVDSRFDLTRFIKRALIHPMLKEKQTALRTLMLVPGEYEKLAEQWSLLPAEDTNGVFPPFQYNTGPRSSADAMNHMATTIAHKLRQRREVMDKITQPFHFAAGATFGDRSGHAISFYFAGRSADGLFRVFLFNSGAGLNMHMEDADDPRRSSVGMCFQLTEDIYVRLMVLVTQLDTQIAVQNMSMYYRYVATVLNDGPLGSADTTPKVLASFNRTDSVLQRVGTQFRQIAGSCTLWSQLFFSYWYVSNDAQAPRFIAQRLYDHVVGQAHVGVLEFVAKQLRGPPGMAIHPTWFDLVHIVRRKTTILTTSTYRCELGLPDESFESERRETMATLTNQVRTLTAEISELIHVALVQDSPPTDDTHDFDTEITIDPWPRQDPPAPYTPIIATFHAVHAQFTPIGKLWDDCDSIDRFCLIAAYACRLYQFCLKPRAPIDVDRAQVLEFISQSALMYSPAADFVPYATVATAIAHMYLYLILWLNENLIAKGIPPIFRPNEIPTPTDHVRIRFADSTVQIPGSLELITKYADALLLSPAYAPMAPKNYPQKLEFPSGLAWFDEHGHEVTPRTLLEPKTPSHYRQLLAWMLSWSSRSTTRPFEVYDGILKRASASEDNILFAQIGDKWNSADNTDDQQLIASKDWYCTVNEAQLMDRSIILDGIRRGDARTLNAAIMPCLFASRSEWSAGLCKHVDAVSFLLPTDSPTAIPDRIALPRGCLWLSQLTDTAMCYLAVACVDEEPLHHTSLASIMRLRAAQSEDLGRSLRIGSLLAGMNYTVDSSADTQQLFVSDELDDVGFTKHVCVVMINELARRLVTTPSESTPWMLQMLDRWRRSEPSALELRTMAQTILGPDLRVDDLQSGVHVPLPNVGRDALIQVSVDGLPLWVCHTAAFRRYIGAQGDSLDVAIEREAFHTRVPPRDDVDTVLFSTDGARRLVPGRDGVTRCTWTLDGVEHALVVQHKITIPNTSIDEIYQGHRDAMLVWYARDGSLIIETRSRSLTFRRRQRATWSVNGIDVVCNGFAQTNPLVSRWVWGMSNCLLAADGSKLLVVDVDYAPMAEHAWPWSPVGAIPPCPEGALVRMHVCAISANGANITIADPGAAVALLRTYMYHSRSDLLEITLPQLVHQYHQASAEAYREFDKRLFQASHGLHLPFASVVANAFGQYRDRLIARSTTAEYQCIAADTAMDPRLGEPLPEHGYAAACTAPVAVPAKAPVDASTKLDPIKLFDHAKPPPKPSAMSQAGAGYTSWKAYMKLGPHNPSVAAPPAAIPVSAASWHIWPQMLLAPPGICDPTPRALTTAPTSDQTAHQHTPFANVNLPTMFQPYRPSVAALRNRRNASNQLLPIGSEVSADAIIPHLWSMGVRGGRYVTHTTARTYLVVQSIVDDDRFLLVDGNHLLKVGDGDDGQIHHVALLEPASDGELSVGDTGLQWTDAAACPADRPRYRVNPQLLQTHEVVQLTKKTVSLVIVGNAVFVRPTSKSDSTPTANPSSAKQRSAINRKLQSAIEIDIPFKNSLGEALGTDRNTLAVIKALAALPADADARVIDRVLVKDRGDQRVIDAVQQVLLSTPRYEARVVRALEAFQHQFRECRVRRPTTTLAAIQELIVTLRARWATACTALFLALHLDLERPYLDRVFAAAAHVYAEIEARVAIQTLRRCAALLETRDPVGCSQFMQAYEAVDGAIIYAGPRSPPVVGFEFGFGGLVRADQWSLVASMRADIERAQTFRVRQLLMGRGKTSVILPLLALLCTTQRAALVVLPEHMLRETYEGLLVRVAPLLAPTNPLVPLPAVTALTVCDHVQRTLEHAGHGIVVATDTALKAAILSLTKHEDVSSLQSLRRMAMIVDEIDLVYEPLRSTLNFPAGDQAPPMDPALVERLYDALRDHQTEVHSETGDARCRAIDRRLTEVLRICARMRYNHKFGFSLASPQQLECIPFSAANTPIEGSSFADPDVVVALTIKGYMEGEIHPTKLHAMWTGIANVVRTVREPRVISQIGQSFGCASILTTEVIHAIEQHAHQLDAPLFLDLAARLNRHKRTNPRFLRRFFFHEVLPGIYTHPQQYSCSFVDVLHSSSTQYKAAFSGTTNMTLPVFSTSHGHFVQDIDESGGAVDAAANGWGDGSVFSAMLGLYGRARSVADRIHHISADADAESALIGRVWDGQRLRYNAIIDVGAFLLGVDVARFAATLATTTGAYVIYKQRRLMVVRNGESAAPYIHGTLYPKDQTLVLYMNNDAIGVDIDPGPTIDGLITISDFNRITDVAQGMFRMRKLNRGHTASFLVRAMPSLKNAAGLLYWLLAQDDSFRENASKPKRLLQLMETEARQLTHAADSEMISRSVSNALRQFQVHPDIEASGASVFVHPDGIAFAKKLAAAKPGSRIVCIASDGFRYRTIQTSTKGAVWIVSHVGPFNETIQHTTIVIPSSAVHRFTPSPRWSQYVLAFVGADHAAFVHTVLRLSEGASKRWYGQVIDRVQACVGTRASWDPTRPPFNAGSATPLRLTVLPDTNRFLRDKYSVYRWLASRAKIDPKSSLFNQYIQLRFQWASARQELIVQSLEQLAKVDNHELLAPEQQQQLGQQQQQQQQQQILVAQQQVVDYDILTPDETDVSGLHDIIYRVQLDYPPEAYRRSETFRRQTDDLPTAAFFQVLEQLRIRLSHHYDICAHKARALGGLLVTEDARTRDPESFTDHAEYHRFTLDLLDRADFYYYFTDDGYVILCSRAEANMLVRRHKLLVYDKYSPRDLDVRQEFIAWFSGEVLDVRSVDALWYGIKNLCEQIPNVLPEFIRLLEQVRGRRMLDPHCFSLVLNSQDSWSDLKRLVIRPDSALLVRFMMPWHAMHQISSEILVVLNTVLLQHLPVNSRWDPAKAAEVGSLQAIIELDHSPYTPMPFT